MTNQSSNQSIGWSYYLGKPFRCLEYPACDYTCVSRSMLNSHMKSHSSFVQFRCRCGFATKYRHTLKAHCNKAGPGHGPDQANSVGGQYGCQPSRRGSRGRVGRRGRITKTSSAGHQSHQRGKRWILWRITNRSRFSGVYFFGPHKNNFFFIVYSTK